MEAQTEEEKRTAKIQTYAEALDFFIDNPKAISDHALKNCIEFFKYRINMEVERRAKGLGTQKQLVKA